VYSFEYTDIQKVFKPHYVGYCCTNVIRGHYSNNFLWSLSHSAIRGHCCATMCSSVLKLLLQCDLKSLLRNNVFQKYSYHYCTDVTRDNWSVCSNNDLSSHCWTTMHSNNGATIPKCWATMNPGHAGCLLPWKNATDRQTHIDGPIRCSSPQKRIGLHYYQGNVG
jgi:hypothetical protein